MRELPRARPLWLDEYRAWYNRRWPQWRRVGRSNLSRHAQLRRAQRQRLDPARLEWLRRQRAARVLQRIPRRRWRFAALLRYLARRRTRS